MKSLEIQKAKMKSLDTRTSECMSGKKAPTTLHKLMKKHISLSVDRYLSLAMEIRNTVPKERSQMLVTSAVAATLAANALDHLTRQRLELTMGDPTAVKWLAEGSLEAYPEGFARDGIAYDVHNELFIVKSMFMGTITWTKACLKRKISYLQEQMRIPEGKTYSSTNCCLAGYDGVRKRDLVGLNHCEGASIGELDVKLDHALRTVRQERHFSKQVAARTLITPYREAPKDDVLANLCYQASSSITRDLNLNHKSDWYHTDLNLYNGEDYVAFWTHRQLQHRDRQDGGSLLALGMPPAQPELSPELVTWLHDRDIDLR